MTVDVGAFLAVSAVVIVTPGPDMAMILRNALRGGRAAGRLTAVGVVAGLVCWTVTASAGLAALLLASEPAFVAVKLAGAAYLVLLGLQSVRGALRRGRATESERGAGQTGRGGARGALRQGLLSNLGNPKIAVFFTSLLPQFTATGEASFATLLTLGLAFCALTLLWFVAYTGLIARAGDVLRRPRVRRTLEGLTGGVLVALGVRLATARSEL